jgi:hypothetical protein
MAALTLSFAISEQTDAALEALAEAGRADILQLLGQGANAVWAVAEVEYELEDLAGNLVPSNEALIDDFGDSFQLLLTEQINQEAWNALLERGEQPTASLMLFYVVRFELQARLLQKAKLEIERRAQTLGSGSPGNRGRLSSLAAPE